MDDIIPDENNDKVDFLEAPSGIAREDTAFSMPTNDQFISGSRKENPKSQTTAKKTSSEEQSGDSFDEAIGRTLAERHPDWPHVKLKFYFSPHETADDISGIKEQLADTDIVLYENYFGNHLTERFQEMANVDTAKTVPAFLEATRDAYRIPKGSAYEGLMRALYGSKKIVGHIDLRPGDSISGYDIKNAIHRPYMNPNFDKTLTNLNENFRHEAQLQQQREQIMQQRFEEELERIITAHPELKKKGEIKLLVQLEEHILLFTLTF